MALCGIDYSSPCSLFFFERGGPGCFQILVLYYRRFLGHLSVMSPSIKFQCLIIAGLGLYLAGRHIRPQSVSYSKGADPIYLVWRVL